MSYGGSSLIIMCVATALMLRVYHEATEPEEGEVMLPKERRQTAHMQAAEEGV